MNHSLFYVTFARDLEYLKYSLRSIERFATGFSEVCILVPDRDLIEVKKLVGELPGTSGIPMRCVSGNEWGDGKGFMWHLCQKCRADQWCPNADFVTHFDPDCVFLSPVTPETFFRDDKPILQFEPFASIRKRRDEYDEWQRVTELCLPFPCPNETMRQHGITYRRDLYARTRKLVVTKTQMPFDDYVQSCKPDFKHGFCEFVTLGNVAIHEFPNSYYLWNLAIQPNPDSKLFPIGQFWSHRAPNLPQDIWWDGRMQSIVPMQKIIELGL